MAITVRHEDRDRYDIEVRGHRLSVDQPPDDSGPTPVDLFLASLASCAALYAVRFLRRHGYEGGLVLTCDSCTGVDGTIRAIRLTLTTPSALPVALHDATVRAMEHCTVMRSIRAEPEVDVLIDVAVAAGVAP